MADMQNLLAGSNTNVDEWALANMPFTHTAVYQA